MSRLLGSYGLSRPATFTPEQASVYYLYTPNGGDTEGRSVRELDATKVLSPISSDSEGESGGEPIWGLYELTPPEGEFDSEGTYDIYIKPKEIRTVISDCAFLVNSSVKGIVVDGTREELSGIESFDGYRVEYYENGERVPNFFRVVTSTTRVEPVNTPSGQGFSSSPISYSVSQISNLYFLTLSPSSNIVDSTSTAPFLGLPSQEIVLANTFFEPIHISLEVSNNTIDSIAEALFGNQLKNVDNGQYGIFNDAGELIQAYLLAEIRNEFGDKQYEIRRKISPEEATGLDFNQVSDDIDNNAV